MESTKENLENIKTKLIEHISENYEKNKAEELINNVRTMNEEEFMSFLKEQGLINGKDKVSCIFCSIIFGDIPSTKIDENDRAIAILDINPASLGHSLIVPKEHISSKELLPSEVGKLALLVKRNLEKSFNPKRVDLISSNIMGHEIINLLPVYNEETINSERKKLFPNDLEKLKEKIIKGKIEEKEVDKKILEKNIEEINEKNTWLPKRFP